MLEAGLESAISKRAILGNNNDYDSYIFRNGVRSLLCHYLISFLYLSFCVYN